MIVDGRQQRPDVDWDWAEDESGWLPPTLDTTRPSTARIYDYMLGGKDNFAVDRDAAALLLQAVPDARQVARDNRDFLAEAVRTMAEAGIQQYLDLGTGIPTSPNVHEIARSVWPDAAVAYVDNDPVVLAHNRALLARVPGIVALDHDLRDPAAVNSDPVLRSVLDLSRPVGVLMVAVLHFVDLAVAPTVVARYLRDLPSGSHLAISAGTRDGVDPAAVRRVEAVYAASASAAVYRTQAQVEELFDGLDVLPPGVHEVHRSTTSCIYAGIARKP